MASKRIQGITIEIGGDTTKLQTALRDVDKQLRTTQGNLKDIDKLLKFNPGNTELLSQKQRNLQTAIKDTQDRLKELKSVQKDSLTPEQYDALQREIIETEGKLKDLKKQYKEFGSVGKQQIKAVAEKMKEVGKKISEVGDKLTQKVTLPLVAVGTAGVASFAEVDKTMQLTNKTMGNTAEEAELLNKAMKEAAANSTFGMKDAATATLNFARAGLDAEQAAAALAPAMNLAAGEGGNLDTVSSGLVATINGFHGSFKDAEHYADVFATACNESALDVDSLSHAMSVAAPIFSAAGYTVNDAALYMGVMANNGIEADKAANSLKTGLARLVSPAKDGAEKMKALGISVTKADGSMKDSATVQRELHDAFSKLSESEQLAAASAIFGKNQMAPWLALINTAPEDVGALDASLASCAGTTEEMSEAMMSGFGGSIEKLKSSIDVLVTSIGEALAPHLQTVITFIQGLVDKFNALTPAQQETIVKIGAAVAAIGPVLSVGGRLISGIGSVIELLTGPAGIAVAIGAVIGFLVNLYETNEEARDKIDAAFTAIAGFWTNTLEPALTAIWSYVTETLAPALVKAWQEDIQPAIETAFTAIAGFWTDTLEPALTAIWSYVTETLAPALIKAWQEDIQPTIESVFSTITSLWNDTLKPTFEAIYTYVVENLIPTLIEWWENHLQPVIENVFKAIAGFWEDTLKPTFDDIQKFIVETLAPKFTELGEAVTGFVNDNLIPFVDALSSFMSGDGAAVVTWLKDTFVAAWEGIKTEMQAVLDFITGVFKGDWGRAWDALVTMISTPFNTLGEILKTPINAVVDGINWMIDKVEGAINSVIDGINDNLRIDVDFGKLPDFLGGGSLGGIHWGANLQRVDWGRIDKLLANGGVLGEGQRAIVGEYAPEILRVVNGRAVVTPMTNQPARLGGNQTVNITINAQPGQSAEQIAAAVKRVFVREMQERSAAYA